MKTGTELDRLFLSWAELDWVHWRSQPVPENVAFSDEIWGRPQWIWMTINLFLLQSVSHCVLLHSTEVFRSLFISENTHYLLSMRSMSEFLRSYLCSVPPSPPLATPTSIHPALDKEKAGTVKEVIWVWKQDVNTPLSWSTCVWTVWSGGNGEMGGRFPLLAQCFIFLVKNEHITGVQ